MRRSLVLGFFDGVHTAHRAVIESAVSYAGVQGTVPVLVTLKNSPALYFTGKIEYIFKREYSLSVIKNLGINEIIELDFEKFVSLSAVEFLEYLVKNYSPKSISTGFNHTFGNNKSGNSKTLYDNQSRYGYDYICVPEQFVDGDQVSSTKIKQFLKSGNIKQANKMLQNEFFIEGKVEHGKQLGRTLGFPTANIKYPDSIVKIPYGVYKTNLEIDNKKYCGMMNWGVKPTIENVPEPIAEVHIINYKGDLYGRNIKINITDKIRDEKKFSTLDELRIQIEKDVNLCLKS